MMKKYFLQTAAMIALLCGAASCSNDDNGGGNDPEPGPSDGSVTYAECDYYGDVQNATKFALVMLTSPVDNSGNPTGAGSKYYLEIYSSKVTGTNPFPAAGTYQFDAQSAQKAGSIAANASYMLPIVMSGGAPSLGTKVNFKAGSITVSVDGNNIKVEGSLTLTTGKAINVTATSFKYVNKAGGVDPEPEPDYTGYLQENVNMGTVAKVAALYAGDIYSKGNTAYTIMLANNEVTEVICIDVMGPATSGFEQGVIPEGTFEIAFTAATGSAVGGLEQDNGSFGTYYINIKDEKKPVVGYTDSGTITISKSGNNYSVSIDAATEDGYTIKGSYTGPLTLQEMDNSQTTLTGDLALDLSGVKSAQAVFNGKTNGATTGTWFFVLDSDTPKTDMLCIQIFTESATYSTTFPTGTYTCAEDGSANTFIGGFLEETQTGLNLYGSYYYKVEGNTLLEFAPAAGGTIKVEKDGSNHKFTIDIVDDGGNKITGTWAGPASTIDGTKQTSAKSAKMQTKSMKMSYGQQFISDYTKSSKLNSFVKRPAKIQLPLNK